MESLEKFNDARKFIEENNTEVIKQLIDNGIDVNLKDDKGCSLLHIAAGNETDEMIKILLANNSAVNVVDVNGETPLIVACKKNKINNIRTLIEHGADVNFRLETTGSTALHFAAKFADEELIKFLLNHMNISVNASDNDSQMPLIWACSRKNNVNTVATLLDHGADITEGPYGQSGLHFAAKYGDSEMIKLLLERGISINTVDSDEKTSLMWACEVKNNVDNVNTLLACGADVNMLTSCQKSVYSALHFAALYGDKETIECLLNHNISVNINSGYEKLTPLLVACSAPNNLSNVVTLLERGADVNLTNVSGSSALHYAAKNADRKTIECLLNYHIPVNVTDTSNEIPLKWACLRQGNVDNVMTLLEHGADINFIGTEEFGGGSLLHYAARWADSEIIKCLLDHGISVNTTDKQNNTPLLWACRVPNNKDNVATLLTYGADTNIIYTNQTYSLNQTNYSILHVAVKCSDIDTVKCLLDHNAPVNVVDPDNQTPLMWAFLSGYDLEYIRNVVATLLAHGADVNATSKSGGYSALHLAAKYADSETIRCLLDHGISINVVDKEKDTPLMCAVYLNKLENVAALIERGADLNMTSEEKGASILHIAAKNGSSELVKLLLDHNISVNVLDNDGRTPLAWACKTNYNVDIVKMLIEHGADISLGGRECLHLAAANSDENVIKYLIEQGSSINAFTEDKRTPLSMACEYDKFNNVDVLIKLGADLNAKLYDGCSILHVAARFSDTYMINYLVDCGVSVNSVDDFLSTPLHSACEENRVDNVKCLISLGADAKMKTVEGWSLLHVAAVRGNVELIQYLFDIGLDVNLADGANITPLMWAQRANQSENVALLRELSSPEVIGMQDTFTHCLQPVSEQLPGNKGMDGGYVLNYVFMPLFPF